MRNEPIKVLCVDDNDLVAEGLRMKLRHTGDFEWMGSLREADDLVKAAWRSRPHVVLLDIDMPGKDPFEAMRELTDMFPSVRVLMLSGHVRRELIDRAIESGAWGYVSKNEGADVIVHAIERVARGEFTLGPDVQDEYRRL
jgi:DNA-binding NarL/FixJ family response regulator